MYQSPERFSWWGRDTSRPRQMIDIQYGITIMGGREVSRPYRAVILFLCPYDFSTEPLYGLSGKLQGAMIMHCCRIVNGIKNKKHKKQPWGNVECFAFGGATMRFASLETSFHAAHHTVPPPRSYEGYPLCPKDKNCSPFHGEKKLMVI